MESLASPHVPVSWGELLDKLTILEIKRDRIHRSDALANVEKEYRLLRATALRVLGVDAITDLMNELRGVNDELWKVEDSLREHEGAQDFGSAFVALARSVYRLNDRRAAVKRRINLLLRSELVEEKSYADPAQVSAAARPIFFTAPAV
jgi:hypothetical protein